MKYQDNGTAIRKEMITSITKSRESRFQTLKTEAPSTFLTPISFLRCSATKDVNPNRPRHDITTARNAKKPASRPMRSSSPNFLAYSSSTNLYSNDCSGLNFLNMGSIFCNAAVALSTGFSLRIVTFPGYDKPV